MLFNCLFRLMYIKLWSCYAGLLCFCHTGVYMSIPVVECIEDVVICYLDAYTIFLLPLVLYYGNE